MREVVDAALRAWGFEGVEVNFIAARENAVYEVRTSDNRFALRLHRQTYRTDEELWSELQWMAAMAQAGISVPAPVPTPDGQVLMHFDGVQVDVLAWLDGQKMTDALPHCVGAQRGRLFFDLGRDMARLHQACDAWSVPPGFTRVHWDREGLLGDAPLWDRFWENPELTVSDRYLFEEFRQRALASLDTVGEDLDYGLIHADLVPENVLIDGETLQLIDFDDGGYGYRLFDVATALLKHRAQADFEELKDQLIDGYRSVRPLDLCHLNLFLALRAATYVGWNITRMDEPGGVERNARFIAALKDLATQYLQQSARS